MAWDFLLEFAESLTLIDYSVILVNILLIIFAHPILQRFSSGSIQAKTHTLRVHLLRGINVIILFVYAYTHFFRGGENTSGAITLIAILGVLYLANMSNYLIQYFIHKQYGKAREIGDKTIYVETYQTRLLNILSTILVTIMAIIAIVRLLDFDSILEAGGVLGIIGVFLGLTQSSWAPDIISGLIILNSDMLEEGDIVESGDGIFGRVYKTKMFHTEILNISNNHRVMIRNSHLRDRTIHNLSKFATAKGLRECLLFNIGYSEEEEHVKEMFQTAFTTALENGIPIESNSALDIKVEDTGDHAVTWAVLYHIKNIDKVLTIRRDFREIILKTSKTYGIDLATPFTHQAR